MTGLALATLGALAILGQADGRPLPNLAEIRGARLVHLNGDCANYPDFCHHSARVDVRRPHCAPRPAGRVRCRFEERIAQFYIRRPRWQRVGYDFVYDAARSRWMIECRSGPSQSAGATIIRC